MHLYAVCYLYAPGSKRVTQFQFSVCMYGTCGRTDNKADFDFDFLTLIICQKEVFSQRASVENTGILEMTRLNTSDWSLHS